MLIATLSAKGAPGVSVASLAWTLTGIFVVTGSVLLWVVNRLWARDEGAEGQQGKT